MLRLAMPLQQFDRHEPSEAQRADIFLTVGHSVSFPFFTVRYSVSCLSKPAGRLSLCPVSFSICHAFVVSTLRELCAAAHRRASSSSCTFNVVLNART